MSAFIYLASQSPRRSQLLTQIGVAHELLLPDPAEDAESLEALCGREAPGRYVARVTGLKLDAAVARLHRLGLRVVVVDDGAGRRRGGGGAASSSPAP